jgi:hydrogenase maturation protease
MNQQAERTPLLVMGVGNTLRGDDGFGVAVLNEVGSRAVPGNVDLLDAGTSIIDLMEELNGRRKVVVVDAVRGGQPPGTLYRFSPEDVAAEEVPADSLHQVGLFDTLRLAELVDCRPEEVVIIGAQPEDTSLKIGLTEAVAAAVPRAAEMVMAEINGASADND